MASSLLGFLSLLIWEGTKISGGSYLVVITSCYTKEEGRNQQFTYATVFWQMDYSIDSVQNWKHIICSNGVMYICANVCVLSGMCAICKLQL